MTRHEFGTPYTDEEIAAIWAKAEADAKKAIARTRGRMLRGAVRGAFVSLGIAKARSVSDIEKRIDELEGRE